MFKKIISYIPHGINPHVFRPLYTKTMDESELKLYNHIRGLFYRTPKEVEEYNRLNPNTKHNFMQEGDFVFFFNSRNALRKNLILLLMTFKKFRESLNEKEQEHVFLLLHTEPVDVAGTDALAIIKDFDIKNVIFSSQKISEIELNIIYNLVSCTVSLSNAEGFGLSTAESIMAGTPILATVTGGLQDQMRFVDENGECIKFTKDFPTNSVGKYTTHGEWAFPVFPNNRSYIGSPFTPYIYNDNVDEKDVVDAMLKVYNTDRNELKKRGLKGREWMLTKESGMSNLEMASRFIENIDYLFEKWVPRERVEIYKIL